MKIRSLALVLLLVVAACSDSSGDDSTTTTASTTTTEETTTTVAETTTTEPPTTTSEATTTTTTEPEETTTTSEGDTTSTTEGDTTTTTGADTSTTSTTYAPPPPTTSTTLAAGTIDPDLEPWAGLFKQPAGYPGFMEFRADGVVRAGYSYTDLSVEGAWDYDAASDSFVFSDFDIGGDCQGAEGRYDRETARGGGRTLTLIDDPCTTRVEFLTMPGATCLCMTWLEVNAPEE